MPKIVSFGDSFIFGNELQDNEHGDKAWPALAANHLGCEYQTMAIPGCGNESIAQQIYTYFARHPIENTLAIINWTWSMRWDFYIRDTHSWVTLGPTCVPGKLEHHVGLDRGASLIDFYNTYTGASDVWNRFRSLQTIWACQCFLSRIGATCVETAIDLSIFQEDQQARLDHYQAVKDESWPDCTTHTDLDQLPTTIQQEIDKDYQTKIFPDYVRELQRLVRPRIESFDGLSFLDWSRSHQFDVSALLHPLEHAHKAAADKWTPRYRALLDL